MSPLARLSREGARKRLRRRQMLNMNQINVFALKIVGAPRYWTNVSNTLQRSQLLEIIVHVLIIPIPLEFMFKCNVVSEMFGSGIVI